MKAFITTGTKNVLQPIIEKHPTIKILKLKAGSELTLYYEASHDTLFKSSQSYEILEETNPFIESGFVVMFHTAVLEDKKEVFTKQIEEALKPLHNRAGFLSSRLLKRIGEMGYIICIQWQNKDFFDDWIVSDLFKGSVLDKSPQHNNIFKASYLKMFQVIEDTIE